MSTLDLDTLPPRGTDSWVQLKDPATKLAAEIADTDFVPRGLRNNPPAILAAILFGAEIGLPPMQALSRISVIDGRPSVAAETQRGLIFAAGHELWLVEATTTRVTMAGRRRGSTHVSEVTWTMDDAKRAGLAAKPSWRSYPRPMLIARASAELARLVFPDVIGGMSALEELDDVVSTNGSEPTAESTPRRRPNRRSRGATVEGDETPAPASESAERPSTSAEPPDDPAPEPSLPPLPEPEPPSPPAIEQPMTNEQQVEAVIAQEFPGATLVEQAEQNAEEPVLMTDPQRRKMQALFRGRGVTEREARLAYVATAARRKVSTSNELTIDEAASVIDALEQWNPEDPNSKPFPPYDPATAPFPEGY